jgi:VanZ family protein
MAPATRIPPPVAHPATRTAARLGAALFAYMLGITLVVTLLPFHFARPLAWRVMTTGGPVDIVANVLMFVPLGFLWRMTGRRGGRHELLQVVCLSALASLAIESAQLFEVERYASVLDVAANAIGGLLGAAAFRRLSPGDALGGRMIGRLSLELPLIGLVYLMVPLLWLVALGDGGEIEHVVGLLLLGLFGASLMGGMQRHHFGPIRSLPARTAGIGCALWYAAGAFPLVATRPLALAAGTAMCGLLAWWLGRLPRSEATSNRRFEVTLLVSAAPAWVAYLGLVLGAPLLGGAVPWHGGLGLPGATAEWSRTDIVRFLELVAAFTLLGYMVAEFRGRVVTSFRAAVPRLIAWGTATTAAAEGIVGVQPDHGASLARAAGLLGAMLFGGWLYYLQREHVVVRLLGRAPAGDRRA